MATATQQHLSDYDRAVAWQMRSMEIAERDELVATRKGYGETCQMFEVPSRSNPHQTHVLTYYTAGAHNGQIFCPCHAQAHGLPCGHVGAVLLVLDYERSNMQTWMDATAGYQDEMPTDKPHPVKGICEKCGRANRTLRNTGTDEFPYFECGTCIHRRERSQNTREMYGRGRRGY